MESIVERCTSSEKQKIWVLNNRANTTDFDCYKKVVLKFCDILGKVMTTQYPPPPSSGQRCSSDIISTTQL